MTTTDNSNDNNNNYNNNGMGFKRGPSQAERDDLLRCRRSMLESVVKEWASPHCP